MKHLTPKQTQVLVALEQSGRTTLLGLSEKIPVRGPSQIWHVVQALVRRGLVVTEGDPRWMYAGTPETFIQAGYLPPDGMEPFYLSTTRSHEHEEMAA